MTGTLAASLGLNFDMAIVEVGGVYEVVRSGSLAFDILAGARDQGQEETPFSSWAGAMG